MCIIDVGFFFFKQKTAYEMRISDWSSDVCFRSDGGVTRKIGVIELPTFYSDFGARSAGDKNFKSATRDVERLLGELKLEGVQGVEIGRASCRERVGQYV